MIEIDGSYGEGGGQILRTAIALSCVTGEAVRIVRIRANRPKPGLAAQHLRGIEAAKMISGAEVEGLRPGSTEVIFKPGKIRGGDVRVNIGTAGSITLIFQSILLPLVFAEQRSTVTVTGGTDVAWSPPVDYFRHVTLRALRDMGLDCHVKVLRRGYYPKGGGVVRLLVEPGRLKGKKFKKAHEKAYGVSHCQNLPEHVAERQAKAATDYLAAKGIDAEIKIEVLRGHSTGSGITLWSGYKGGSALGERGKRAEVVGKEAAEKFYYEFSNPASFDCHLADQILPFASMADGVTEYTTSKITLHLRSNAYVVNSFFANAVEIDEERKRIKIRGRF
ncbi:RNA 3'-terminal phosphate cyclase [Archaeoglobus neptunius]|uniref:RNA 3'-terminal phosphate cyclase n=1 Tax=Archaeoglobus neptunius TaxID=2798580 RepID=UPI0019259259